MKSHYRRRTLESAFLLLHGWQNHRPPRHWQHWLATSLRAAGHEVHHPQLPDPDHPEPGAWTAAIRGILERYPRRWTVICHSLSCVAWMHLSMQPMRPVARLLFVAPPSISFLAETPELRAFVPPRDSFERLAGTSVAQPRLAYSDEDPYCDPPAPLIYPDTFDGDLIPGGGHLDMVAGLGPWPELRDWCLDPGRRISCRTPVAAVPRPA
jgi:predicted alpha/beta hydrolase family esterase